MEVVEETYRLTTDYPKHEAFGLARQMQRRSVSIASNIAEGRYRGSQKDNNRFLRMAFSSGAELETQIEISIRIGYVQIQQCESLKTVLEEVMRMLNKLLSITR